MNAVAVAPDGKTFAAATDRNVTCWDSATRKAVWARKGDTPFHALAYSPDGKFLAVAHQNGVTLHEAATGEPTQFPGRKGPIDRGVSD